MADEKKENQENEQKEEAAPQETGKKRFSKKGIIRIVAVLFLAGASITAGLIGSIGLGGVGNLFFGTESSESEQEAQKEKEEDKNVETMITDDKLKIIDLDEMIVNITGTTAAGRKTTRFLKVKVSIVYNTHEGDNKITSRKAFLRDSFQDYLRQLDEKELVGTLGFINLKAELLKRAQAIVNSDEVKDILISDLVVQ